MQHDSIISQYSKFRGPVDHVKKKKTEAGTLAMLIHSCESTGHYDMRKLSRSWSHLHEVKHRINSLTEGILTTAKVFTCLNLPQNVMKPLFCPQIVVKFRETFQRAYSLPPITTKNDTEIKLMLKAGHPIYLKVCHVSSDLWSELCQIISVTFNLFWSLLFMHLYTNFASLHRKLLTCNNCYFLSN